MFAIERISLALPLCICASRAAGTADLETKVAGIMSEVNTLKAVTSNLKDENSQLRQQLDKMALMTADLKDENGKLKKRLDEETCTGEADPQTAIKGIVP